jgi:predicted nucleic acid-binding Zn ribbon protein
MKRSRPVPIKDVLKSAVEKIVSGSEDPVFEEDIKKVWERVAGKEASRHSSPAALKGRTLIVNVDSPTWIYQLNTKKEKIEKKLNRLVKEGKRLNIRLRAGEG